MPGELSPNKEAIAREFQFLKISEAKGFSQFYEKLRMALPKLKKLCYSYG